MHMFQPGLLNALVSNPVVTVLLNMLSSRHRSRICCGLLLPPLLCRSAGPRPCLKTQTAGLCRLCFVSAGESGGRGGGRDLFTWRYTGYGRSQGVVTGYFFSSFFFQVQ